MAAQKREKEETELKVPESLPLCSPPPPSPPQISVAVMSDPKLSDNRSPELIDLEVSRSTSASSPSSLSPPQLQNIDVSSDLKVSISSSAASPESTDRKMIGVKRRQREVNRCSGAGCRRKVGLMPFRCRCGEVFCSEHRYSDRHDCTYDYKAAGREVIARENPVVKAAKILKV
ncbi:unnamed protein product [Withania somnifera]